MASSLLAGLILLTISYDLITVTFDPGGKGRGVMQVILATWFICGLVIVAQASQRELWGPNIRKALYTLGIYGVVAGLTALIFGHFHLQNIRFGRDAGITISSYYLALFAGLLATALALARSEWALNIPWMRRDWYNLVLYPLLVGGALLIIYVSNLSVIKADIYYNHGLSSFGRGRVEEAIALYKRALDLAPKEDFYYFELARSLQRKSREAKSPEEREAILKQAIAETEKARELNPLNTDHTANLGRLYLDLASAAPDPSRQAERLDKSLEYFQKALELSPNAAHLWNELAAVYLAKGNFEQGIKSFQRSLSLDAEFDQTYLTLANAYLRQGMLEQAEEIYKQGLKFNPHLLQARSGLSLIYANRGDFPAAIAESLAVLKLDPNNYDTHKNLSLLYRDMGNLEAALAQAMRTLEVAPEGEKPKVEEFIRQLEAQKAAPSQPPGAPPKSGG